MIFIRFERLPFVGTSYSEVNAPWWEGALVNQTLEPVNIFRSITQPWLPTFDEMARS